MSRKPAWLDNNLVSLATPVFDLILQVKANLVIPSVEMRQAINAMLQQMEQQAESLGFKNTQTQAAKFALAAFVDETVLIAKFPLRDYWEKTPLQLEYFGEQLAGNTFFERLQKMMEEGEAYLDAIELYYVCLLLGFKGRYNIYYEEQLKGVITQVADFLRRNNRLRTVAIAPHWKVTDQPQVYREQGLPMWFKVTSAVILGLLLLIYFGTGSALTLQLNEAKKLLLR
ncbi:MAG: type IVB secretion system protein IcmH/DotU [Acidobacteriota bacterium]